MPGNVIQVERKLRVGRRSRPPSVAIARAFLVAVRRFFGDIRGFPSGAAAPDGREARPEAFRGMPVLVETAAGQPRCVACGLCEFACPADCIEIIARDREETPGERFPAEFRIDMARCMFCGLCEEACPEAAIVMSGEVEIAAFDRASLVFGKDELLVPEALLERRLAFLAAERNQPGSLQTAGAARD